MRYLIAAALVLSCSLCLAADLQKDYRELKSLTVEQASYLAAKSQYGLVLKSLTSIDKDVAHELAKESKSLTLNGLTSIDKDVAQELGNSKNLSLKGLTSIDKNVAEGLAKCTGWLYLHGLTSIDKDVAEGLAKCTGWLYLHGLTSIDKDVAQELAKFEGGRLLLWHLKSIDEVSLAYLKSNRKIQLPEKYRD